MNSLVVHIPDKLFAAAESLSFKGTYFLEELNQRVDTYYFADPLVWQVSISNIGGALFVSGTVFGEAKTQCVRCLDDAFYQLNGEVEGYFLIPGSDIELTEEEKDEYIELPESHLIDLEPLLRAALVLELPYTPLCDENCRGLCAGCGANLNHETCTCSSKKEDDFLANPFAVLKDYPFNTIDD